MLSLAQLVAHELTEPDCLTFSGRPLSCWNKTETKLSQNHSDDIVFISILSDTCEPANRPQGRRATTTMNRCWRHEVISKLHSFKYVTPSDPHTSSDTCRRNNNNTSHNAAWYMRINDGPSSSSRTPRKTTFLFQRLFVVLQQKNAVAQ